MPRPNIQPADGVRTHDRSVHSLHTDRDAQRLQPAVSGDGRGAVRQGIARMDGVVPAAGVAQPHSGTLPIGGQHTSGTGRADGGNLGAARRTSRDRGPCFDQSVSVNGYAWWYVDAISDDGRQGLTIIAFIGSVFSPYYAAARRRGHGDPQNHCAVNVALYGKRGKHWALTERRKTSLMRSRDHLTIGESSMSWDAGVLTIDIQELAIPRFSKLSGKIRVYPSAVTDCDVALDRNGHHHWRPIAPRARIDVQMAQPDLRWCGSGYFDSNAGSAPLEDDFTTWTWSRADIESGAAILYEVIRRDGAPLSVALRFDDAGAFENFEPPPTVPLRGTGWRIARETRSEDQTGAEVLRTLEDTPFYARSVIGSRLLGAPRVSMHESLSLDRFRSRWVQTLLPFRMPRAFR